MEVAGSAAAAGAQISAADAAMLTLALITRTPVPILLNRDDNSMAASCDWARLPLNSQPGHSTRGPRSLDSAHLERDLLGVTQLLDRRARIAPGGVLGGPPHHDHHQCERDEEHQRTH